ncbi:MAG: hypothetical protein A2283_09645 [Lentisphaerae bacterium RIFOXYA12_FULL_48_11]|nr:MAG: hypothetical protein A2283_09645 [Lentisphaerae bacterium RIFOXYA12_FULL_48_11]
MRTGASAVRLFGLGMMAAVMAFADIAMAQGTIENAGQFKARDKFWIFGVRAGQDDTLIGRCAKPHPRFGSKVTPAEAALYLNVPNMIMVNCDGVPAPFSQQAEDYAFTFTSMKKVLWSSTGSGGYRAGNEEEFIVKLAEKHPNICGAFMDDFFGKFHNLKESERTEKTRELLKTIRAGLDKSKHPLELYVVWYTHETGAVDPSLFQYIDGITLWTWDSKELPQLEERFIKIEKNFPGKKKLLGIYLYDFKNYYPVPKDMMELQCELGLKLMKEGRLDGLIFEANSVMGVGFPNDNWTRQWIQRVGETVVPK